MPTAFLAGLRFHTDGAAFQVDTHTDPSWHQAAHCIPVAAPTAGTVQAIDALAIGKVGVMLGAGRKRIEDDVDFAAGVQLAAKVGTEVSEGDTLCKPHEYCWDCVALVPVHIS